MLDRFDLRVEVSRPGAALFERGSSHNEESSESIRARVVAARERQLLRQNCSNSELRGGELERVVTLRDEDRAFLAAAIERWGLSARAYHRVLRVARSIADLDDCADIDAAHIAEALAYRIGEAQAP